MNQIRSTEVIVSGGLLIKLLFALGFASYIRGFLHFKLKDHML